jgi:hypothetical protein
MLAQEPLRIGNDSNLKRIQTLERTRAISNASTGVLGSSGRAQRELRYEVLDLRQSRAAPEAIADGQRPGEQRRELVALFLDAGEGRGEDRVGVDGLLAGNLVEAVVDGVALRLAGEEAPGDDLAGVATGLAEVAVLVLGGVMPSQGSSGVLANQWYKEEGKLLLSQRGEARTRAR